MPQPSLATKLKRGFQQENVSNDQDTELEQLLVFCDPEITFKHNQMNAYIPKAYHE